MKVQSSIITDRRQVYLNPLINYTIWESSGNSNYSLSQTSIRSVHAKIARSENHQLRKHCSNTMNINTRWSLRKWNSENDRQRNHEMKRIYLSSTRTKKIELRNYLYKIKATFFSKCSCGDKRQTMHHTLLKYLEFNELKRKMWADKRETNLIEFLGTFALIAKVFEFLLTTGELMQFKHLNETQTKNAEEALKEDNW